MCLMKKHISKILSKKQMNWILTLFFLFFQISVFSQILAPARSVDWTLAGLRNSIPNDFVEVDMLTQGVVGNGIVPNDAMVINVLSSITEQGAILIFPAGNFLFNSTITIPSNVIIRGQGADNTVFTMDLGGTNHSLDIRGSIFSSDNTSIIESAAKDNRSIYVDNSESFSVGQWIQIIQEDSDLVTSSWAVSTVGQIVRIKEISNNEIILESPLRMSYEISRSPYIVKINPIENVGIECLKIKRIDDTAPQQTSNINFIHSVNCWVKGVESENCTFSHIQAVGSSNLYISNSYFHHAFGYGVGGRAYGVMLQATTNECLIENNIFEHLRHSMIAQSGANGNVFAYNYSFDPFWPSDPNDSAGDMVIHGNYPYSNLFEHNICQNIIIDNSHGPNGPHNTFFRNRAEGFGIFFSENNSPNQNFIGNEIPNTNFPYILVNYTIKGEDHFLYGNNNKGIIHPMGTDALTDISYAYNEKPDFIPAGQWAGIGTPNVMGVESIPAYDRYESPVIFSNICDNIPLTIDATSRDERILIYPNPVQSELTLESSHYIKEISVLNSIGLEIYSHKNIGMSKVISSTSWQNGMYLIVVHFSDNRSTVERVIKTNSI